MNVGGTAEVLRMATAGSTLASVHFISSTSVFDAPPYLRRARDVSEEDTLADGRELTVGYGQSKWIAEQLCFLARSRGVPVTVFRPGYITGHSETGIMNLDDFLVRLLKGCVQLGMVPRMMNRLNMCSVDFVSQAIVHAATRPDSLGKAFHIWQPEMFRFRDFFGALSQYGFKVAPVDYPEWRDALMKFTLAANDNALFPLLHFVLDDLPTRSTTARLSATNLTHALQGSYIVCQPVQQLMGTYLAYLVQCGYLPKPSIVDAGEGTGAQEVKALPELELAAEALEGNRRSER
eukprot:UC1_evm2s1834